MVADLSWIDLNFDIPLSAKFCWGRWEFGRTGRVARQDDGTYKSKSTQPRSETTSVTLYTSSFRQEQNVSYSSYSSFDKSGYPAILSFFWLT